MPHLSARLVVPVAVVVVAWGGVHLLTSRQFAVTPAVWPVAAGAAAAAPSVPTATGATATPGPAPGAVPVLPGALRQLNASTRDTAVGLYALIQQMEDAVRSHLEQLAQQLEPGR